MQRVRSEAYEVEAKEGRVVVVVHHGVKASLEMPMSVAVAVRFLESVAGAIREAVEQGG